MTLSIPRSAVILVVLAGAWWIARRPGSSNGSDPEANVASPAADAGLDRAMRSRLELAVVSAANSAQCGYGEPGYTYRPPEEAPRHLVALMRSAAGARPSEPPAGPPAVDYVVGRPERAWQVAVRLDPAASDLVVEGFGPDLSAPLFVRRIPCS